MTANCILERVIETRSTNDDLLERWRAGELIDPVARIAQKQTAGKGRAGRSWLANPEDSLCFSLAFPFKRTPAELSGLSLLVGLAVISGIAKACDLSESKLHELGLRLKWPNDLLLNNAKLAGILIEGGQAKTGDSTWMIIGVGINLRNEEIIAEDLGNGLKVSSLTQITQSLPDVEYLWLKLIASLEHHLTEFDLYGFKPCMESWMKWDAYRDQAVCISGAGRGPIYGVTKGVDESGALVLQQENKTIAIHAGDVSLRIQS
ncbi:biotin--[acetyl-CoA-carboxylase] ligase [Polynucleobacter sp. AP-Capit-er-40B-B4]|uniref:biotin--[acetyl-CoA-carboxylase] ligase n=1 Tax=Polynucleobacter sp. AP-Capit-er-40B-B4 TaxID=2576927 RepID=UPI001C0D3E09|nr:biotin--[acetyl-CoA-carboxylase] ligase [Polynucleobacter sp. AP-Capit-er-40B-B4]MBU3581910.1 biotin--[acetyl-CoA-carboxylase] ligase [Polynucleobacter sp. AP-Capit-er-40B-B4]